MDKYRNFPFPVLVGNPGSDDSYRRMLAMMSRPADPVFLPVFVHEPTPIPDIDMFNHSPLVHTPIAITRSVEMGARRKPGLSNSLMLAATVALLSNSTMRETSYRITGTAGLRERLKSLEKNLQRHPGRNDIKLQIMELRNQIRDIEAQNARARQAQSKAKVKKRK